MESFLELMTQGDFDLALPQAARHPARQLRGRGHRPAPHALHQVRPIVHHPTRGPVDHDETVAQLRHEHQERLERLLLGCKGKTWYGPRGAIGERGELGQHGDRGVAVAEHDTAERQSGAALERGQRRGVSVGRSQHDELATTHTTELPPCTHHGCDDLGA